MATILPTKSIYFNDVNLIPKLGVVKSRKDIPQELHRIIVSPMKSIVGGTFIQEASRLGLSVAIPRFLDINEKFRLYHLFEDSRQNNNQLCFIGIGLNEGDQNLMFFEQKFKYTPNISILVDMANGYIPQLKDKIGIISNYLGAIHNLLIGNIVTADGLEYIHTELHDFCQNLFCRIGIGNGMPCKSSDVAGINRGQITELMECDTLKGEISCREYMFGSGKKNYLVSDGGISKSGFALKAFGAGADYCLMGGYWKNALEAEANITGDNVYYGCASATQNKLAGLERHSEGKEIVIDKSKLNPLKDIVDELWGGLSSGISYVGHRSIKGFIGGGLFEEKNNSLPPKNRY